jgi:uncharacterized SAM-binding protein YcdF (DUF218 family)
MQKLKLLILVLIAAAIFAVASGPLLVSDHPQKSDAIVVLGGDRDDIRYNRAVELLRQGYGKVLLLDASADGHYFGKTEVQYAQSFLDGAPEDIRGRVQVCPYEADSTFEETESVVQCLKKVEARSALIVTSTYHTRRALSTFRKREPGYQWSATGAPDPYAWNPHWWKHREWAKTHLGEWERMIWWQLVDRWRA